jgi:hypothetical protein
VSTSKEISTCSNQTERVRGMITQHLDYRGTLSVRLGVIRDQMTEEWEQLGMEGMTSSGTSSKPYESIALPIHRRAPTVIALRLSRS